jgi:hypothetical protein
LDLKKSASSIERFNFEPFNSRGTIFKTMRLITASGLEHKNVQVRFAQK